MESRASCLAAADFLPAVWAARYLAMHGKRRLIGSFWHGHTSLFDPAALAGRRSGCALAISPAAAAMALVLDDPSSSRSTVGAAIPGEQGQQNY